MREKRERIKLAQKQNLTGWVFLLPAVLLIVCMSFYPIIQTIILSLKQNTGVGVGIFSNYVRLIQDSTFKSCLFNTFFYLIIQVPIMLMLAGSIAEQA